MSLKGLDTVSNCKSIASDLKKDNYDFVCRYYNVNNKAKNLTSAEAVALAKAGIGIVAVWENGYPTKASYFTKAQGETDGKNAFKYANKTIGQTEGTPIFFAVDYDAAAGDMDAITKYFNGVMAANEAAGGMFPLGVYGSGAVCKYLKDKGKVDYTWLAQSTGWRGYSTFDSWDIKQGSEFKYGSINGDHDTSKADIFF